MGGSWNLAWLFICLMGNILIGHKKKQVVKHQWEWKDSNRLMSHLTCFSATSFSSDVNVVSTLSSVNFVTQLRSEFLKQPKPYSSYSYNLHTHTVACSSAAHSQFLAQTDEAFPCKHRTECDTAVPKPVCYWSHLLKGPDSPLKPVSQLSPARPSQPAELLTRSFLQIFCFQLFSFAIGLTRGSMVYATCLNLLNCSRLGLKINCEHLL